MNRDSVRDTYQKGFLADGFKHVNYVEIEGMGHGIPEAKWVEGALDSLDAPLTILAKEQFIRAQQLDKSRKVADAILLYTQVELHGDEPTAAKARQRLDELRQAPAPDATPATRPVAAEKPASNETEAQSLLSLAENYERNRLYSQSIQRLEKILKDYPDSKAAAQAKVVLERVKSKQR